MSSTPKGGATPREVELATQLAGTDGMVLWVRCGRLGAAAISDLGAVSFAELAVLLAGLRVGVERLINSVLDAHPELPRHAVDLAEEEIRKADYTAFVTSRDAGEASA